MSEPLESSEKNVQLVFNQHWRKATEGRSCGTCAECCTWLGIEELRKWTGQTCKHLDGRNPSARCSIYESRPKACVEYYCLWRAGFGPEELKPDKSGMLLTPYRRNDKADSLPVTEAAAITVLIFDDERAKELHHEVAVELITLGVSEVRLVNLKRMTAMLYQDGKIYRCKILKPKTFEELVFSTDGVPIATYTTKELESD